MSDIDDTKGRTAASKRGSKRPVKRAVTRTEGTTSVGGSDDERETHPIRTSKPPPECLRKKGLLEIRDNIPPGYQLQLPPNALADAFGAALFEKFMAEQAEESRAEQAKKGDE